MKILKEGKLPEPKTYKGKCSHCGCMVECVENEIGRRPGCKVHPNDKYSSNYVEYFITCPTSACFHTIVF